LKNTELSWYEIVNILQFLRYFIFV